MQDLLILEGIFRNINLYKISKNVNTDVSQKAVSNLTKILQLTSVKQKGKKKKKLYLKKCTVEWDRISYFEGESVENFKSPFALRQSNKLAPW